MSGSAPFGGSAGSPQDLDGDKTYEDINGDGLLSLEDPALLGFYIDSKAVLENAEAFDFNGDCVVDFNDVILLKATAEEKETGLYETQVHLGFVLRATSCGLSGPRRIRPVGNLE